MTWRIKQYPMSVMVSRKFILNKFLRLTGLRYQDIKPIERKEMSEVISDLKNGNADLIVSWLVRI